MTDLDRKIAELKGFPIIHEKELMGTKFEFATNSDGKGLKSVGGKWWSTDIAKAFELVDEVEDPLFFVERYGKKGEKVWKAHFSSFQRLTYYDEARNSEVSIPSAPKDIMGEGQTPAEAICRAYIALKEWEGKK